MMLDFNPFKKDEQIPGFKGFKYKGYEISFILEYFDQVNPYIKIVIKNKKFNKAIGIKYPIENKVNLDIYSNLVSSIYGIIDFIENLAHLEAQEEIRKAVNIAHNPCFTPIDVYDKDEVEESEKKIEKKEDKESELTSWFDSVDTSRYLHDLEKENK